MPTYTGTVYNAVRTYNVEDPLSSGASVVNSDGSYQASFPAGPIPYSLPNITLTDWNGVVTTHPSVKNLSATQININQLNKIHPRRRRLTNYHTLITPNNFGNLARYTDINGRYYSDPTDVNSKKNADGTAYAGTVPVSNYVIDHHTGDGWYIGMAGGGTPNAAATACLAHTHVVNGVTYDDYVLMELHDLNEMMEESVGMNFYPFRVTVNGWSYLFTNTEVKYAPTNIWATFAWRWDYALLLKTTAYGSAFYLARRTHYP